MSISPFPKAPNTFPRSPPRPPPPRSLLYPLTTSFFAPVDRAWASSKNWSSLTSREADSTDLVKTRALVMGVEADESE